MLVAGLAFTGLGLVGAFLPFVPTTPFLLLAAACLSRSSPRLHRWLLSNRVFGAYIEEWRRSGTVPRTAKRKAYLVVLLTFGASVALVDDPWARGVLVLLGGVLVTFLVRLPTSEDQSV